MPRAFIVTEDGCPRVAEEITTYSPSRLAAMGKFWLQCKAFDGISRYEARPEREPSFSFLQRFLAQTLHNPPAGIQVAWQVSGACSLKEIVEEVEKGLATDDDIIQQWFSGDDVLKLLRSAQTFDEMVDRVRCVCGEFETDARLGEIVEVILDNKSA